MVNFLQGSEPEDALQMSQQAALAQTTNYDKMATNALVSQYGPEAADPVKQAQAIAANSAQQEQPTAVAADIAKNTDVPQEYQRQAQLRAAYALKSALDNGVEGGTAWDTIVGPNAASWGLDPAHAAAMRQHLSQDPKEISSASVDALINGLAGPAKPVGAPENLRDQTGQLGGQQLVLDDRGGSHVVNAPAGTTFAGPLGMAGAPQVEIQPDGTSAYRIFDKSGHSTLVHTDGTPVKAAAIGIQQQKANAATQNAATNAYSAGVRENNSAYGAPGGAGPPGSVGGVPTSMTGNVGPGQIGPKFWQTFSHPGEEITNPADNIAVANRGISYYQQQYKDPARTAVAYYSGPQNVAPPGSATPYIRNIPGPGPGQPDTATYASQVTARVRAGQTVNESILHQESGNAAFGGQAQQPGGTLFDRLPPKGRQMAVDSARQIINGDNQLQSIDGQIGNIKTLVGPFSVGAAAALAGVPGTAPYNMKAALHTLQAQGLTTWLSSMKNSAGQTGIGRVLQSEVAAAQSSFGALDQGQSEDQFRYHLGIFQSRIHQVQATARAAYKQQYGVDPNTAVPGSVQSGGGGSQHFNFVNGQLVPG